MTKESHVDPVLSEGRYCAEVNISFIPGARVSGRVTDSRRQPLENVGVVIKDTRPFEERPIQGPDRFFGTSDKAGRYEIQGILPGPYTVSVAPANFRYGGNVLPVDIRVEPRGLPSEMSRGVLSVSTDQNVEGVDLELPVR